VATRCAGEACPLATAGIARVIYRAKRAIKRETVLVVVTALGVVAAGQGQRKLIAAIDLGSGTLTPEDRAELLALALGTLEDLAASGIRTRRPRA
jgi:hypothetical protein